MHSASAVTADTRRPQRSLPRVVESLYEVIAQIAQEGLTLLIVEQFAHEVLKVADVAALLVNGRITFRGRPSEIDDVINSAYLGYEAATESGLV